MKPRSQEDWCVVLDAIEWFQARLREKSPDEVRAWIAAPPPTAQAHNFMPFSGWQQDAYKVPLASALLTIEQIQQVASGSDETCDDDAVNAALVRIDKMCKAHLSRAPFAPYAEAEPTAQAREALEAGAVALEGKAGLVRYDGTIHDGPTCRAHAATLRSLISLSASAGGAVDSAEPPKPEWIVNDIAELGVKVGDRFYFLYKGRSLVYDEPVHDEDGKPMHWRPVFKREFGECCHPINYKDPTRIGTVSLDDDDEWQPLPAPPKAGAR